MPTHLVLLLFAILAIAVLAALIGPVFAKAKETGRDNKQEAEPVTPATKIRAKFQLMSLAAQFEGSENKTAIFAPQYDTSIPEDQRFQQFTPSGRFEIVVNNPNVLAALEVGKQYYIDLTPAA